MSNDQFTKLFKYLEKRFDEVNQRFEQVEARLDQVYNLVDQDLKRRETDEHERLVMN